VSRIKTTIKCLVARLKKEKGLTNESDWHTLGKCLLFLRDHENAAIAFEQMITFRNPLTHLALCDCCDPKGMIAGLRYVCSSCRDTDLCSACYQQYQIHRMVAKGCRDHVFLEVPRNIYSKLGSGCVNIRGQTTSECLSAIDISSNLLRNLYITWQDITRLLRRFQVSVRAYDTRRPKPMISMGCFLLSASALGVLIPGIIMFGRVDFLEFGVWRATITVASLVVTLVKTIASR
jgi:Zinc finger, ZZ type